MDEANIVGLGDVGKADVSCPVLPLVVADCNHYPHSFTDKVLFSTSK
jgi:hypothetical protein